MAIRGYILNMPGRPSEAMQRRSLAAMGVDSDMEQTCWTDNLSQARRHRSAGQKQLEGRNALLQVVSPGDRVMVCDPTCLGVSAQDAAWFIKQLAARDVTLTVTGDLQQVGPGENASELIEDVARRIRNTNTARSRAQSR